MWTKVFTRLREWRIERAKTLLERAGYRVEAFPKPAPEPCSTLPYGRSPELLLTLRTHGAPDAHAAFKLGDPELVETLLTRHPDPRDTSHVEFGRRPVGVREDERTSRMVYMKMLIAGELLNDVLRRYHARRES